jgi:hypothetical protein
LNRAELNRAELNRAELNWTRDLFPFLLFYFIRLAIR